MIKGLHLTYYTPEAEALRAFFRDKLDLPYSDAGGGWLIFELPAADIGCHPAEAEHVQSPSEWQGEAIPVLSFYCDDLHATVAQLKERGVEFTTEIREAEYGLTTRFRIPGRAEVELYQPSY